MKDNGKYIKRGIKNISRTAIGSVEVLAGIVGTAMVPIVGVPILIDGTQRLLKGVRGEYIKNSMINVMSNNTYAKFFHGSENRIIQEFPSVKQLITGSLVKDKTNLLLMQELNFLLGADTFNRKGERVKYTTHSQSLTKFMLTRLQRAGMLQDFECTETKPKALIMERLMLGNVKKGLFKKDKMYNMSFSKTDKKITEEDISKFLKIDTLDNENYVIKRDKDNNILSINYRTSKLVKDKMSSVKDKFLPEKPEVKMLPEAKDENQKNTFQKDLSSFVKRPDEIKKVTTLEKTSIIEVEAR